LGLRLDPILQLSGTHAHSDENQGSSSADVVKVLGTAPLAGTSGRASGNSTTQGALVDTGATPVGRVKVAPWSTSAASTAAHRRAAAATAVASIVFVNNSTLFVDLLRSQSVADHDSTTGTSTGSASSDGAVVGAGGLVTVGVLHSEASSEHGASSWLLGINETHLGTNEQLGSICSLAIAPVASLACLDVVGGIGQNNGASILDGSVLNVLNPGALQLNTTTGTSSNSTPIVDGTHTAPNTNGDVAPASRTIVRGAGAGRLPRTGAATVALAALGLLLTVAGLAVVMASRVRSFALVA
jgi:LPXTG-motif cell wall-anchored protein